MYILVIIETTRFKKFFYDKIYNISIVRVVVVFGNNTASNISKLFKISRAASASDLLDNFEILQAGIISKYYVQLVLLFVYNTRQISNPTRVTYDDRCS